MTDKLQSLEFIHRSEASRVYRIRLRYWVIGIGFSVFYAVAGTLAVATALQAESWPEALGAGVFAACCAAFCSGSSCLVVTCWRGRLVILNELIFQQRLFGSTAIQTCEMQKVEWRGWHSGNRNIVLRSFSTQLRIELGAYPHPHQLEIIEWVHETFPESMQSGWDRFPQRFGWKLPARIGTS